VTEFSARALAAVTNVAWSAPGRDEGDGAWAEWFDRKAAAYDLMASESSGDRQLADYCASVAEDSRLRARRLRGGSR